ncbi:zinc finger BED domain-containing protein RICESLEEPER 2-like [Morus notabilis]|uniref:zinc finger BED domain-containing protein RICESLEEPER 2-like n=1 Tax=Morus notabilis TaxID=981085 RepID=UPI000CED7B8F|nr:zinc finger BED domain-containing protein RICESLEEPER 2-like [Morus notabilis]
MHDLPFQFVEYKGLRAMLQYLYPDVELVSRNTAKADSLKLYAREKMKIKNMLDACPGRISLTSDLWTSLTTYGYLCLTAHFLDKNWKLHKRIISFCLMPPPHTGIALSEKIFSLLSDWGIEEKIFSITLDNAASNDVSVDALQKQLNLRGLLPFHGEFFHLRCCAHILNLVVQDGLKSIDKSVEKIRDSVKYVKGSQQRKQKFLECVKLVSMGNNKGLSQDVVTRWNSTYLMLESALFYRHAFQNLELSDSNYKNCPNSDEWERVRRYPSS